MWLVSVLLLCPVLTARSNELGPSLHYAAGFPRQVTFLAPAGTLLPCPVSGTPSARISWFRELASPASDESEEVHDSLGVRQLHPNGSLQLLPMTGEKSAGPSLHDGVYYCTAENAAGRLRSLPIRLTAVFREPYTVHVEDQRAMLGQTAVFRCLVPPSLSEHISIVSWEKDTEPISSGDRYRISSTGALYVSDVQTEDGLSSYRCSTRHRYTSETRQSNSGRLTVTGTRRRLAPARGNPGIHARAHVIAFIPPTHPANPAAISLPLSSIQ